MDKINVMTTATLAFLAVVASMPAFAYVDNTGGGALVATPEQIEQCKKLGIPEFTCTEQAILARLRYLNALELEGRGSGTALFASGFGEMGMFVGIIGAMFGGVAAAFFVRAKTGKKVPV
jgi:hypothetical protein